MAKDDDISVGVGTTGGAHVPHAKYEKLIARAKEGPPVNTIVAHPCDETSLRGATEAAEAGIIVSILVGPVAKIASVLVELMGSISAGSTSSTCLTVTPRLRRRCSSFAKEKAGSCHPGG